jgi:hypothetical protein
MVLTGVDIDHLLLTGNDPDLLGANPQEHSGSKAMPCSCCQGNFPTTALFYNKKCGHTINSTCLKNKIIGHVKTITSRFQCPVESCSHTFADYELKSILKAKLYENFMKIQNNLMYGLLEKSSEDVTCVNCKTIYLFEPGSADFILKGPKGKILTYQQKKFYAGHRFKCRLRGCNTEQCKSCQASPFHLGFTCSEFKNMVPCRYCGEPLTKIVNLALDPFSNVCDSNPECTLKIKNACNYVHEDCEHRCGGLRCEYDHPPCLKEECVAQKNLKINQECLFCGDDIFNSPA